MGKKQTKLRILLWSLIALTLTGMLINLILNGDSQINLFSANIINRSAESVDEHSVNIEGIDKIKFNLYSSDIIIKESDDDKLKIIENSNKQSKKHDSIKISSKGNEVDVYSVLTKKRNLISKIKNPTKTTEIYLPKNFNSDLEIKSNVGDLKIYSDLKVDELILNMKVGDIEIGNIMANRYDINGSVGDINIDRLSGSGNIKSSVGDIECGLENPTGTINIKGKTGDVDVNLLDNSGYDLNTRWSVGEFECNVDIYNTDKDGSSIKGSIGEGPYCNLNISSNVGDVTLKQR